MHNVFYIPDLKFNLLSVFKDTKQLNCVATFYTNFCIFQDLSSKKVKIVGKERKGLYFLMNQTLPGRKKATTSYGFTIKTIRNKNDVALWHKRLGHISSKNFLIVFHDIKNDVVNILNQCSICPWAKQSRLPFPKRLSISTKVVDLVHMDVWGPYKSPSMIVISGS